MWQRFEQNEQEVEHCHGLTHHAAQQHCQVQHLKERCKIVNLQQAVMLPGEVPAGTAIAEASTLMSKSSYTLVLPSAASQTVLQGSQLAAGYVASRRGTCRHSHSSGKHGC
jgi:hypothetical protein